MKIELSKEETFEAIKEGVKEAFLTAMEAGNGESASGPIIREPILKSIEDGVFSSFNWEMPDKSEFKNIFYDAVYQATLHSQP